MTNARHADTATETTPQATRSGEQLSLALAVPSAPRPLAARQLPAQLRLDARTRAVGRAGIAEIRRILAQGQDAAGSKAA